MTDELDDVVRGLEAERYRRSPWWRANPLPANHIADELDRLRLLAAETEKDEVISNPQVWNPIPAGLVLGAHEIHTSIQDQSPGETETSTPESTEPVDDAIGDSDLLTENGGSRKEAQ